MTNEEQRVLREINNAFGFMLIAKNHPDIRIARKLARMNLVDRLEDQAPVVAFFRKQAVDSRR